MSLTFWEVQLLLNSDPKVYRAYQKSKQWQELKAAAFKRDKHCQFCKSEKNLIIHHKSYERVGAGIKGGELDDIIVLDSYCHMLLHKGKRITPRYKLKSQQDIIKELKNGQEV